MHHRVFICGFCLFQGLPVYQAHDADTETNIELDNLFNILVDAGLTEMVARSFLQDIVNEFIQGKFLERNFMFHSLWLKMKSDW